MAWLGRPCPASRKTRPDGDTSARRRVQLSKGKGTKAQDRARRGQECMARSLDVSFHFSTCCISLNQGLPPCTSVSCLLYGTRHRSKRKPLPTCCADCSHKIPSDCAGLTQCQTLHPCRDLAERARFLIIRGLESRSNRVGQNVVLKFAL